MAKKLKTYVIFVSLTYPFYHSKKKRQTNFVEKITGAILLNRLKRELNATFLTEQYALKLHTFRGNYLWWKKRTDEVLVGNAVIVLKYHTLGRYVKGNKQIAFARFDKNSGIGIQEAIYKTDFEEPFDGMAIRCEDGVFRDFPLYQIAENDGLLPADFRCWFEKGKYNLTKPMACIHFTNFRYEKHPTRSL